MPELRETLHYTGATTDRGGIVAVLRALAAGGAFRVVHGVSPGFAGAGDGLPLWTGPALETERISPANLWRARAVARAVRSWLAAGPRRIFHGHSRAGLLVALWLRAAGERRVVVSVHCYGRQRWFYRWAAGRLGRALFWLSPAMKAYYGAGDATWTQCRPGCVVAPAGGVPRRGAPAEPIRLGGVGALVPWKRWDLVPAALALLPAAARARWRFRHIGADDGSAASRAWAAALRTSTAGPDVDWLGPQASSAGFLAETDVLVVASENEPFSIAMLEALHAGVPVIAADSGGARDVIVPGRNGWLFRSGDAADLARCLEAAARPGALAAVAPAGADLARFDARAVAAEWETVYRGVAGA